MIKIKDTGDMEDKQMLLSPPLKKKNVGNSKKKTNKIYKIFFFLFIELYEFLVHFGY